MPLLPFKDFITCFRKQFIFQKSGGFGRRTSSYYPYCKYKQELVNDQWAIMTFIYTGHQYGFSDLELWDELKISKSLYEILKEEVFKVVSDDYYDKRLHDKVKTKAGLVINAVYFSHQVRRPCNSLI